MDSNVISETLLQLRRVLQTEINMILKELSEDVKEIKKFLKVQEVRITALEKQYFFYDKRYREKNIIIHGLPEIELNRIHLEFLVLKFIEEYLQISISQIDLDEIFRMGNKKDYENTDKIRAIKVKFVSYRKRTEILRNRLKLQGLSFYITEDLPRDVIALRRELMPQVKKLRELKCCVYLKYDKICVNGKVLCDGDAKVLLEDCERMMQRDTVDGTVTAITSPLKQEQTRE